MVRDAVRGYLALATGVTEVTATRARAAAKSLVEQAVKRLGLAPAGDVDELTRRVRELERTVRELKTATRPAKKTAARKPAAKASPS